MRRQTAVRGRELDEGREGAVLRGRGGCGGGGIGGGIADGQLAACESAAGCECKQVHGTAVLPVCREGNSRRARRREVTAGRGTVRHFQAHRSGAGHRGIVRSREARCGLGRQCPLMRGRTLCTTATRAAAVSNSRRQQEGSRVSSGGCRPRTYLRLGTAADESSEHRCTAASHGAGCLRSEV